jgi:hypothetical protein
MPAARDGESHGRRMKRGGGLDRERDGMANGSKQRGGGCKRANRASLMRCVRGVTAVRAVRGIRVAEANHKRIGGCPDRHLRYDDAGEQQLQGKSVAGRECDQRPDSRPLSEECQHQSTPEGRLAGFEIV